MRLELSVQASKDIALLHSIGAKSFGRDQAARYTAGLLDLLDLIPSHPEMARVRPEFSRQTRLIRYRSHVVFYRVDGEIIRVVRILHGRQNWNEHL